FYILFNLQLSRFFALLLSQQQLSYVITSRSLCQQLFLFFEEVFHSSVLSFFAAVIDFIITRLLCQQLFLKIFGSLFQDFRAQKEGFEPSRRY
ncbi:hypothetical protein B5E84_15485, partial [Lachnoclostridium sp. An14]|uniref:hypothetical protein n=1 Tax=Lachnoclostridium sp. An14 TaxID=1965562 RepID=UPI000B585D2A